MPLSEIQSNWHVLGRVWRPGVTLGKFQVHGGKRAPWNKIFEVWKRWEVRQTAELVQNQEEPAVSLSLGSRYSSSSVSRGQSTPWSSASEWFKEWWHCEQSYLNIKARHGWMLVFLELLGPGEAIMWCGHKRWRSGLAVLKPSSYCLNWSSKPSLHRLQHCGSCGSWGGTQEWLECTPLSQRQWSPLTSRSFLALPVLCNMVSGEGLSPMCAERWSLLGSEVPWLQWCDWVLTLETFGSLKSAGTYWVRSVGDKKGVTERKLLRTHIFHFEML